MLILTPNRRLCAFSQRQYHQQQFVQGKKSWISPEIYPIYAWLTELWQRVLERKPDIYRPLINPTQQQYLIGQIIQDSSNQELLRANAAAQNVIQAWNFLHQWQLPVTALQPYTEYSPDTAAFYHWISSYMQWLNHNQYYDFPLMVDELIKNLDTVATTLPREICLRGFSELTPQHENLCTALKNCGVQITHDSLIKPGATCQRIAVNDQSSEFKAAAQWARQQLDQNPEQTIGVVVPELAQTRALVANAFESVFCPELLNISAPLPMLEYKLISSALLLLQMAKEQINFSDLSIILRSPYIKNYQREANRYAQLDRELREHVEGKVSWKQLTAILPASDLTITECINQFVNQFATLQGSHSANYWITCIENLLAAWGWPGECLDTATEADLLSCWRDLLTAYHGLQPLLGSHTFAQALQMLQRLASETPFLPAEVGTTKVHVLGMLEADGILFDNLWVCGMTRDSWPQAASPNPYIPFELQRELNLPRSNPQRELAVALRLTANLKQGARNQVWFSHAEFIEDHRIAPSNLIADLTLSSPANALVELSSPASALVELSSPASALVELSSPASALRETGDLKNTIYALETWHDTKAPKIQAAYLSGGTTALSLQELCPFKAVSEIRLKAKQLKEPQMILTAAERGTMVHEILEAFWRECRTHSQLLEWWPTRAIEKLTACIVQVLNAWQTKRPLTLTATYLALEHDRLLRMLTLWLTYEAKRNSFTVYQLEQKFVAQIGALQLKLQVDRIDQLADGSLFVIDYKTGTKQLNRWEAPDILDPQLPAYAVYAAKDINAFALAILRPNKQKFIGLTAAKTEMMDVKPVDDWAANLQAWQSGLEHTASKLAAGEAKVQPHSTVVCKMCKLQAMCRIYDN